MKKRLLSAVAMAIVTIPAVYLGGYFYLAFVAVICGCSIYELLKVGRGKHWSIAVYFVTAIGAFFLFFWEFIIGYITKEIPLWGLPSIYDIKININIIISFLIILLSVECVSKNFDIIVAFYLFTMTLFICVACQGLLFIRYNLGIRGTAYIFLITIICDSVAHIFGTKLGKRKLAPNISPKKTVEGAIAGVIGSGLFGTLYYLVFPFTDFPYAELFVIIFSFILGGGAVIGDLIFSSIKRQVLIKDFGDLFPGHGGMLDRVDSLLFNVLLFIMIYSVLSSGLVI